MIICSSSANENDRLCWRAVTSPPPTDCCCCRRSARVLFTLLGGPPHSVSSHSVADSLSCLVTVANTTVLSSLWQQMRPPFPPMSPIDPRCVCVRVRALVLNDPDPYSHPTQTHNDPLTLNLNCVLMLFVEIKVKNLSVFKGGKKEELIHTK